MDGGSVQPPPRMSVEEVVQTNWQKAFQRLNGDQPGISGLLSVTQAWKLARDFLYPRDIRVQPQKAEFDTSLAKRAFEELGKCKMLPRILDAFIEDVRRQHHLVAEEIEQYMELYQESNDSIHIRRLICRLAEWQAAWQPIPELGPTLLSTFNLEFQTLLFSTLPPSFPVGFKEICRLTVSESPDTQLWADFESLGLLERYESLISSVCYEQIEAKVRELCPGKWNGQMLSVLRTWMADKIVPWMVLSYARGAKNPDETRSMLQGIGSRFDYHVCKTLCDLRTSEIFDIIVDYPDSNPALLDLKECLQRVDQRSQLVQTVRRLNRRRLLHPGADTKIILLQYVSMIRCLRIVDPQGVLLHKVADPVRRYLRDRPDTIRSIVASLVGEGGDLVDENEPIVPLQTHVEDYADPAWEPEAIDAGPEFRTSKPSDVISTLVSIYDSKDLFVKELQILLAQRLLAVTDGNYDKERRNIEILKIRFGEAPLQVCEVMLKDMTDSRRTDQHVQSQKASVLHPTVISKHFWPPLQSKNINLPGQLKEIQDAYAKEFTIFKPDKKLKWLTQLGSVELTVELNDRTIDVEVSPLEGAIIELFAQKGIWEVKELVDALGSPEVPSVQRACFTWVDHGVLKETSENNFVLLEVAEAAGSAPRGAASRRAEVPESAVMSAEQQEAEQIRVFWKFIEGMLTNLGQLPLDRIQTMLKFAPNYNRTVEQLGYFMEGARREGLVTVHNGMWKLNK